MNKTMHFLAILLFAIFFLVNIWLHEVSTAIAWFNACIWCMIAYQEKHDNHA